MLHTKMKNLTELNYYYTIPLNFQSNWLKIYKTSLQIEFGLRGCETQEQLQVKMAGYWTIIHHPDG
jgi:hypothetical protein